MIHTNGQFDITTTFRKITFSYAIKKKEKKKKKKKNQLCQKTVEHLVN